MGVKGLKKTISLNPFTAKSDLIDFTVSNARRFYSSKGDPLEVKWLKCACFQTKDATELQSCKHINLVPLLPNEDKTSSGLGF